MGFRLGRLGIKSTYNVAAEYFMNHVNLADEDDLLIANYRSCVNTVPYFPFFNKYLIFFHSLAIADSLF